MTIEPELAAPRQPPLAQRRTFTRYLHGESAIDDYAWMRDGEDPAFRAYLLAERAYYDADAQRLSELSARLAAEAASRAPLGDEYSVAWPLGGFMYRTRLPAGSDDVQLLRAREGEEGSDEQLVLDENLIAAQTGFADIAVREPSPDGTLLAWSADTSGAEVYALRIRDLRTGDDLPEVIARSYTGVAWSAASDHLFYLVPDDVHRPFQVWRHRVGSAPGDDVLVFEEPDQRFELTLERSRSGRLAMITSESRDTTEVWVIPMDTPLAEPTLIRPREKGIEYRIDDAREDGLYVVTNLGAFEFTLARTSLGAACFEPINCAASAPARDDTRVLRCDVLADHLVLTARRNGQTLLVITDHLGADVREVAPAIDVGTIRIDHAEEYDRDWIIVTEQSLIEPVCWYRLELATGSRELLKRMEVPGYDAARYRTKRVTATAADGALIPVTIAHREDTPLDGSAPCLLYGYGAYESTAEPEFDRSLPSLLDRGVVYAIAHIRGGGEGGRDWWEQGRLARKPTTFTDFVAVADWLAGSDGPAIVDGDRIVSRGISAGGLLQGAVYSMAPHRWCAVVAEVPFVDVVNTMLDATIPLTAGEWDEWGDPREPDGYALLRSYSPYENPPRGVRPPLLVTGALHDPRVGIHEPAKWVARLRATDTEGSRLLFRAQLGVGAHGGPSGRSARFGYEAEVQAFILDAMGIDR